MDELALPRGAETVLDLDINGLYILLSEQGLAYRWHWGLYLHKEKEWGYAMHITRPSDAVPWRYEDREVRNVIFSISVTIALKIAVILPDMDDALRGRIARVPVDDAADANAAAATKRWGQLTCRTWLLRTLSELDDEGYISIRPAATVEEVEQEALSLAGSNTANVQGGIQLTAEDKVHRSVYSVA
ncbi:hypothetical protein G3M48_001532 [Beauveria asiatica]|uniref:Uncharacterized protein n=1 Tax=Beauveria asiatica TaxID=1069075 RepID=A0AAW0RZP9_9HYPO